MRFLQSKRALSLSGPITLPLLTLLALPGAPAQAQQAVVMNEAVAEAVLVGTGTHRQTIPAGTTYQVGQGFSLRATITDTGQPVPPTVTATLAFQLFAGGFQVDAVDSMTFVPPVMASTATTGVEVLITVPVSGRGSLCIIGDNERTTSGMGLPQGTCSYSIDVGDDGTIDYIDDETIGYRARSLYVGTAGMLPVRVLHSSALASVGFAQVRASVRAVFVPDTCPMDPYGPACVQLDAAQGTTGTFLLLQSSQRPAFLVFGWQAVDLPIPGSTCRQLVSLDVSLWLGMSTIYRLPPVPLPPGFQLFAQAAVFGGRIETSNGLALVCPP